MVFFDVHFEIVISLKVPVWGIEKIKDIPQRNLSGNKEGCFIFPPGDRTDYSRRLKWSLVRRIFISCNYRRLSLKKSFLQQNSQRVYSNESEYTGTRQGRITSMFI